MASWSTSPTRILGQLGPWPCKISQRPVYLHPNAPVSTTFFLTASAPSYFLKSPPTQSSSTTVNTLPRYIYGGDMEGGSTYSWDTATVPPLVYITMPEFSHLPTLRAHFHRGVTPVEHLPRDKHFIYKYIASNKKKFLPCFSLKRFFVWYLATSFENMILKLRTM